MLCEKSQGNIQGVLELIESYPLEKIESIYKFWAEITLPLEDREKRMRDKADKAAQEISEKLFNIKPEEKDEQSVNRFLDVLKLKK